METRTIVLQNRLSEDQVRYLLKARNSRLATKKYFGKLIIYSGPFIPKYEEHNRRVHEAMLRENQRLDRLMEEKRDSLGFV